MDLMITRHYIVALYHLDHHTEHLAKGLEKEIKKGWQLLIPFEKALEIPGLILSPMGVAESLGVSATGEFVPKKRITHDLSFPGCFSEESTNLHFSLQNCISCSDLKYRPFPYKMKQTNSQQIEES